MAEVGIMAISDLMALRPEDGFRMVMADPPWSFATYSVKGQGKSASRHYATMDLAAIRALPVAGLVADDAWLWLWAVSPMLPQALGVMAAWGATYVTQGMWSKRNGATGKQAFGTGYVLRSAGEPFLIGRWGKPPVLSRCIRNVIEAPRREHSRKPDEAYAAATLMSDGPRLDLFSREAREGWTGWGDQTGRFPRSG